MKFLKKTDLIIIGIVLLFSIFLMLSYKCFISKDNTYAEIYYKSELIDRINLDGKEKIYIPEQNPNVKIHIYEDKSIAFEKSDCPDKICIKTGRISYPGESAACLPNGIIIKIVSDKNDMDAVVG